MVEKIFDKIESIQEINAIAADLRRIGLWEEIKTLAEKNKVPLENVEEYLKGKRYFLLDGGSAKNYGTARGKLLDEMGILNDAQFGDVIGQYLLKCCDNPEFAKLVLQNHKTLQRCIECLMTKAQEMVTDEEGHQPRKACVAVSQNMVYQWAEEYYGLEDLEQVKEAEAEADKKFLEHKKPKPSLNKAGKRSTSAKRSGKKTAPSSGVTPVQESTVKPEQKAQKEDKNQIEGQVSLF
ncbi:Cas9 inhibitor AcrIIA9 family protein [Hungatella hathewayi]|uniref:Cas9 inhibitor AcrIIA9 family protein n=1 Tax=Hungatella hathewayi TaxID=154046 RepID=UPI0035618347